MKKPLLESLIFHVIIAILLILSTWSFFQRRVEPINEVPIVVTLAPIGEKTNVKPAPKREVKPPTPKKAEPAPPKPTPPKPPEPKKVEPKPVPTPAPKVEPKKVEQKKPDKKKPEKPKEKVDELDALLQTIDEKPKPEKSSDAKVTKDDSKTDQQFDPNSPEALAIQDYIAKLITDQVKVCWSPPAGGRGAKNLIIRVDVNIDRDGTMKFVGFQGGASNDPVAQAAADAAKRAVLDPDCNPLKELPPADKYSIWKEMTLIFDPKDLAQ